MQQMVMLYRVVELWVTGDRAEQPKGSIDRELIKHVPHSVHLSWLKKYPRNKVMEDYHA